MAQILGEIIMLSFQTRQEQLVFDQVAMIVAVTGSVEKKTTRQLEKQLQDYYNIGYRFIILDCAGIKFIESSQRKELLDEQAFQNLGISDQSTAAEIGKLLNADKVLIGSVTKTENFVIKITVRLVDVESGQIEGSRELICENCSERNLPAAIQELSLSLVK